MSIEQSPSFEEPEAQRQETVEQKDRKVHYSTPEVEAIIQRRRIVSEEFDRINSTIDKRVRSLSPDEQIKDEALQSLLEERKQNQKAFDHIRDEIMETRLPEDSSHVAKFTPEAIEKMQNERTKTKYQIEDLKRHKGQYIRGIEEMKTSINASDATPGIEVSQKQINEIDVQLRSLQEYFDRLTENLEKGY